MISPDLAKSIIIKLYRSGERTSVILLGPPGVGKTTLVEEAAKTLAAEMGRQFIKIQRADPDIINDIIKSPAKYFILAEVVLTHLEPVDLTGIPRVVSDNYARYTLLDFMYVLTLKGAAGILFLDEFTADPRNDRRSACLKLINERSAGFRELADDILVVAAGNTKTSSELAEDLDEPMRRGRALIIFISMPSVAEWAAWMDSLGKPWDRRILAFLHRYPVRFFSQKRRISDNEDPEYNNRVLNSPRGWSKLAWLLAKIGDVDEDEFAALISAVVDDATATELYSFLRTAVPNWQELTSWPQDLPTEARYLLVVQIASTLTAIKLDEEFLDKKRDIFEAMDDESIALLIHMLNKETRMKLLMLTMRLLPQLFNKLATVVKNVAEVPDIE